MALAAALGCGVAAGFVVPLLVGASDPTGGWLGMATARLPVAGGIAAGWSWSAFGMVALAAWALLAAARDG